MKYIHNIDPFPNVPIIICKIIASYYTFKRVVQSCIFLGVVQYFDWLKKQPVNQVPSTEPTIIYSQIVVSCTVAIVPPNLLKIQSCTVQ